MSDQKSVRCITINTDASFSHEKKVGGYAFYIISDLFKIQKSGMFKVRPKSAIQAEMMCMANAIHTLSSQPELPWTKWIIINSDCLYSFERIKLRSQDPIGKKVAQLLRQLRLGMLKHIMAHQMLEALSMNGATKRQRNG